MKFRIIYIHHLQEIPVKTFRFFFKYKITTDGNVNFVGQSNTLMNSLIILPNNTP